MYCSRCGTESAADALFCTSCGAPLARAQAAASAAPVSTAAARSGPADAFDEEIWRAAIGPKNTEYYLTRFREQHASGRRSLWNWPAFLLTFYWLLYRKLWLPAIGYFVLPYVILAVVGVAAASLGASKDSGDAIMGMVWLAYFGVVFIAPPMFANSLYYSRIRALIAQHSATAQSRDRLIATLEAKGGTSRAAAILVGVFVVIGLIGILAAIALPAYQDYTYRAKSTEAIVWGKSLAQAVGDHIESTGQIPENLDTVWQSPKSKYVSSIKIDRNNAVIEMEISFGSSTRGGNVYLIPSVTDANKVTWTCEAEPAMKRFVPRECREK